MESNKKYNFSVIIPHKNIPHLLQRCLSSIPRRDDLQIIVVDDNSDTNIVNFEHFPGLDDPYVQVIFTKEGKGAGYARNVGLTKALGKWLLFTDADDFFNYCINEVLDEYEESNDDIIFFKTLSIDSKTYTYTDKRIYNQYIEVYKYCNDLNNSAIKYAFGAPWAKIINRNIVLINSLYFDETDISNDSFFSFMVAFHSSKICVDERALYTHTYGDNTIQTKSSFHNIQKTLTRIFVYGKISVFCKSNKLKVFQSGYCLLLLKILFFNRTYFTKTIQLLLDLGLTKSDIFFDILHLFLFFIKRCPDLLAKKLGNLCHKISSKFFFMYVVKK
jgi:glycosyltransferase involved in cell wall biosynthesis